MKLRDPDLLRTRAYVGGKWLDAASGATHAVANPATRETIGTVPDMGAPDARRAVEAAAQALPAWA
ncbi:MAG: aldehyde dehydrogenase family protein, partial [Steroidobacteraceae bacterium]